MLFIDVNMIWCCAFVPIFYLFFDYTIGIKDNVFFGALYKAKVGAFEKA